jgi:tetratricopeptide (TPR) repeat protein
MHDIDRPMVTDFGLVRFSQELINIDANQNNSNFVGGKIRNIGTAIYRAPEVWNPDLSIDQRSDIYSLGCVIFEMLTGQRAAIGKNQDEVGEAHLTGSLSVVPSGVPKSTTEILEKSLALDPVDRYTNWVEFESALVQALAKDTGRISEPVEFHRYKNRADRINYGWSRHAIAAAYMEIGILNEARKLFNEALNCALVEKDAELEVASLEGVASVDASTGRHRNAITVLNKSKLIADRLGNEHQLLRIRSTLGGCQAAVGNYESAIQELQDVLNLSQAASNNEIYAIALGNLGTTYALAEDFDTAVHYFEQQVSVLRAIKLHALETQALISLGTAAADRGDPKKAIQILREAVAIALDRGDSISAISAFLTGARVHHKRSDFKRAAIGYDQANRLARDIGDVCSQANAMAGMGQSNLELGNISNGRNNLLRAIVLYRRSGDRFSEAETFANLGVLFSKDLINPDKAKACFLKAITIYRSIGEHGKADNLHKQIETTTD